MPQFQAMNAPGSDPTVVSSVESGFGGHVSPWNLALRATTSVAYPLRSLEIGAANPKAEAELVPRNRSTAGSSLPGAP